MVYANFSSNLPTGLQNFEFVDLTMKERAVRDRYRRLGAAGSLRGRESLLWVLRGRAPQQAVSRELVGRALEKDDSFTLHRQVRRRFPRRRVVVGGPYDQWQADLVDVSTYGGDNDGVRYLLCCLDAFTRYAWVRTLRSKRTKEVAEQFQDVVKESPETPLFLQTDKGREFLGKAFTEMLETEGIRHFTSENDDVKCSLVERFQRTLQESVHRFFTARNTRHFLDVLQRLVDSYNATHHRSLGMSPRQALETDPEKVWYNLYKKNALRRPLRPYLQPGDAVRISKTKGRLPDKGYLGSWSRELFRVTQRLKTRPVTYRICDASGNDLKGTFYEQELGKAHLPTHYDVEKVLATRRRGGTRQYLVRWLGYPSSFDSWTSELVPKVKSRRKP